MFFLGSKQTLLSLQAAAEAMAESQRQRATLLRGEAAKAHQAAIGRAEADPEYTLGGPPTQ